MNFLLFIVGVLITFCCIVALEHIEKKREEKRV